LSVQCTALAAALEDYTRKPS